MSTRKPPLHETHLQSGADFTDFGGWDMPVSFDSIRTEHAAVRDSAGIFDVSHMGEVTVGGPDATELTNRLTTNDVTELDPGDAQYACILSEDGTIIDDTVVYFQPDGEEYLFVPNAGNDEAMADRWTDHAAAHDLEATVTNRTGELGMFAVQGPDAVEAVQTAATDPLEDVSRFSARDTTINGADCLAARTGYTGEDGFELIFDTDDSKAVWDAFDDVQACGLGARDTLRLEAGLLLSGQDFHVEDEPRTPYETRLSFVVDDSKSFFVGQAALQDAADPDELLVGLELDERAVPRHGYPILHDGEQVGHVTSGTMSPTLEVPIALGYVDAAYADEGTSLAVEVRDRSAAATVVSHRFLQEHRE
ncbi:glycine cleavage system aminomethyltransferase GcvT [Halobacterium sp. R2-5]|uniref:glycine cleavage system aminomethyltransferase GcvT n=1 Tax=Halobacterium sp. R2-5 TaxID=2715751 RepID=UPI0014240D27|nr:glycine cleavage system aminomethyltransferase GcvT [Halobacterium sp. R2-5]